MDRPRILATCLVAADGAFRADAGDRAPAAGLPPPEWPARGPPVRGFWLLALEPEPEPHFQDAPGARPVEAGTLPASRKARHAHWVEVGYEIVRTTRARPYHLREAMVTRGPVGELLAQEFLDEYDEADALLALQAQVDRERAAEDATRWTEERRRRIEEAQRALDDAFYAATFPHAVVVTALSASVAPALREDFSALRARRRAFSDVSEG